MKLRITAPTGQSQEFPFTAVEQAHTSAMFALQRTTGLVMPKALDDLRQAGDALTLLYYTAWMILWRAGRETPLDDLFLCDIDTVPEPGDDQAGAVAAGAAPEVEADPTPPPAASDPVVVVGA